MPNLPGPPHLRASLIAASLASVPVLQKKTWPPPPWSWFRVTATSVAGWVAKKLEVCVSVATCSVTAAVTAGWACPRLVTARPHRKSRYRLPCRSQSSVPRPRSNRTVGAP